LERSVETPADKPRIFISYARADSSVLAEELVAGLEVANFEPYLDRHDIAAAEDWEARLGGLIQSADTVVFILSPAAVKSGRCAWEVDRAAELGKRVIPIEGNPVPEAEVPQRLRRLNYIFFHEGQSFARPLGELATALRQDVQWIREHTRLGEAAARWQARTRTGGAADDLLLRGDELTSAKAWAARGKENAPAVTPLQREFLAASEDDERQRLAERERMVSEAERAQSNIHRVQQRSFLILTGLLLLVVLGTGAGLWAVFAGWRDLMINRSQFLAGMIDQSAGRVGYVDGMLIGLDALPDETSAGLRQRAVPLEASAENALDGAWRKWSSNWAERKLFAGHTDAVTSVAFSPDGTRILTGSSDKTARLWDVATGKTVATLDGHTSGVSLVAFSPDGARILTGSWDKTARLWDAATGKMLAPLEGHTDTVTSVAFSRDGTRVLTGSYDKTARLWDSATGKMLITFEGHKSSVVAVAFSPDGARVLTGSDDNTARLWDAATGKMIAPLEGHTGAVTAVAFSPDGARVLTGSNDKTARLWDAATGKLLTTLAGHAEAVTSVAFSPDGGRVLTGSDDDTVRLWDAAMGKTVATLKGHTNIVTAVTFSPDGAHVLTGSGDRTARLWPVFSSAQALVDAVKGSVPRCLTVAQRESSFFLHTPPPRWCTTRNPWPFANAAPTPAGWDEQLLAAWDRAARWFGTARAGR
jgi:WD40 repeat protein